MKAKGQGFYIFCALTAVLAGAIVWGAVSVFGSDGSVASDAAPQAQDLPAPRISAKPAAQRSEKSVADRSERMDDAALAESLRDGALPTQEMGEHGSLEGALVTDTPMILTQTRYNYLPDSPLLEFTDDMIWLSGANAYSAKKDALEVQARHIQEASIALSVSPRVEWEKTTGYRLVEVPEKSLFAKMGMVSGDIIVSINGALPDMEPMALMFVNMAAGKRGVSTIVVEHRGAKRTVELRAAE